MLRSTLPQELFEQWYLNSWLKFWLGDIGAPDLVASEPVIDEWWAIWKAALLVQKLQDTVAASNTITEYEIGQTNSRISQQHKSYVWKQIFK